MKSIMNLTAAIVLLMVAREQLSAQSIQKENDLQQWTGAYLNVAGNNIVGGVEVFTKFGSCNSDEVIFLKFANKNDHPAEIIWMDAVYTADHRMVYDQSVQVKTITVKAHSEISGDCSGEHPSLVLNAGDFIKNTTEFHRFAPASFDVNVKR